MPPSEEGAPPEDTIIQETGDADDEFSPFDEMREDFKPSAIRKTTAADGLPTNTHDGGRNHLPVLSPETLVCMGDFSEFTKRSRADETVSPEFVVKEFGASYKGGFVYRDKRDGVAVEPKRPPCKHYVRQAMTDELLPNNITYFRLCAARRTTEGTFMTVRDSAVWACSMREPRDFSSEERYLDAFDALKVEQGKERTQHTIFTPKGE